MRIYCCSWLNIPYNIANIFMLLISSLYMKNSFWIKSNPIISIDRDWYYSSTNHQPELPYKCWYPMTMQNILLNAILGASSILIHRLWKYHAINNKQHMEFIPYHMSIACFTNPVQHHQHLFHYKGVQQCKDLLSFVILSSACLYNNNKYQYTVPEPWVIISWNFEIVNSILVFGFVLCSMVMYAERFAFWSEAMFCLCGYIAPLLYLLHFDQMAFMFCKSLPFSENQLPFLP